MGFNKRHYAHEFERLLRVELNRKFFIKKSAAKYKQKGYINKGTDSFTLANFLQETAQPAKDYWTITICYYSMLYLAKAAILSKGYETDDHYATQIALGHLFVPDQLEKEDLLLLEQAHKILEDDYVTAFEEVRQESAISKYSPNHAYTGRRVEEVTVIAGQFIRKIQTMRGE